MDEEGSLDPSRMVPMRAGHARLPCKPAMRACHARRQRTLAMCAGHARPPCQPAMRACHAHRPCMPAMRVPIISRSSHVCVRARQSTRTMQIFEHADLANTLPAECSTTSVVPGECSTRILVPEEGTQQRPAARVVTFEKWHTTRACCKSGSGPNYHGKETRFGCAVSQPGAGAHEVFARAGAADTDAPPALPAGSLPGAGRPAQQHAAGCAPTLSAPALRSGQRRLLTAGDSDTVDTSTTSPADQAFSQPSVRTSAKLPACQSMHATPESMRTDDCIRACGTSNCLTACRTEDYMRSCGTGKCTKGMRDDQWRERMRLLEGMHDWRLHESMRDWRLE
eukprot:354399-Chlamydomonas_euryale.AAC.6